MVRLHQQVPANALGRDFIVGDLIDRGPDSMGCLRLLLEPWFFAVRGNHENMLLDYFYEIVQPYASGESAKVFLKNGGRWVRDMEVSARDELREKLLPRVATLPYVITVGEGQTYFHVAHAELMTGNVDPDGWLADLAGLPQDKTPQRILTDDQLTEEVLSRMLEPLTWGRRLWRKIDLNASKEVSTPAGMLLISLQPRHSGLSETYVGHTPLKCMMLHESHLFIDRDAYHRDADSCLLVLNHNEVRTLDIFPA